MTPPKTVQLFNSQLESALRLLFILVAWSPEELDIEKLVFLDYLLIRSGDLENAPESLHPPVPQRGGEWIARRNITRKGIDFLVSRELATIRFTKEGTIFKSTDIALAVTKLFESGYSKSLSDRSKWLNENFVKTSDIELRALMSMNISKWGAEPHQAYNIRSIADE